MKGRAPASAEEAQLVETAILGLSPNDAGRIRTRCPFCPDRRGSFSINVRNGSYNCFRCGAEGWLRDRMGAAHEVVPEAAPNPADLGPPESFLPLFEEPGRSALVTEDARAYLLARGLGPAKWGAAGIGACTSGLYAGRVVVPVLAPSGEWLGFVGRAWTKKADMPYRNARGMKRVDLLYNEATLGAASDDPVIVVEGVFDALHVWPDGVAVLGKPSAGQVAKLACCRRPIAVVLDGDAWAEGEALSLKLRLSGQRAGFVRLPPKIDPDEIPLEEIRAAARECIR